MIWDRESAAALDLSGRVALVTGAAAGLGRAEALALAARGAFVVAADRDDAAATVGAIEDAGGHAHAARLDVAEPGAADALVQETLARHGDLHVLVNNAGIVRDRMSFNLDDADWDAVVAVNLTGTFRLCRAAARTWRAAHRDGRRAPRAIVNTSSESGLHGNAGQANYAAAKAGVAALTLTLAAELDRYGVRVNAIAPRARTGMSEAAFGALPAADGFDPFGPEHVAAVVAWLASDAARDVTGQVLVVHGGGVEPMRGWSPRRRLARTRAWSDEELAALAGTLFEGDEGRRVPAPVGALFATPGHEER